MYVCNWRKSLSKEGKLLRGGKQPLSRAFQISIFPRRFSRRFRRSIFTRKALFQFSALSLSFSQLKVEVVFILRIIFSCVKFDVNKGSDIRACFRRGKYSANRRFLSLSPSLSLPLGYVAVFFKNFKDRRPHSHSARNGNDLKLLRIPRLTSSLCLALFIVTPPLLRSHGLLIYYYVSIVAPCWGFL